MSKINNYTAADAIPIKLLSNYEIIKTMREDGIIRPVHAQFIPTNKCNMNCPFCSCAEDDRETEMSLEDATTIINDLARLGCKGVTITGGGEPILHPHINTIIELFIEAGIEVGFVSNGLLLHTVDPEVFNKVTWCRISNGDFRTFTDNYKEKLQEIVSACPDVDWAFSHVVSDKHNIDEMVRIITFANENNFTHVRLVADLFNPDDINMDLVKNGLEEKWIDIDKVIFQGRKDPEHGGPCYICYLKPLIGADCRVYNCCGVQYALEEPTKNLPKELSLGSAFDLEEIMNESHHAFDGSICHKCYYMNYNRVLGGLFDDIEHQSFV